MFAAEDCIKLWFNRHDFHFTTADLLSKDANIIIDIQDIPFSNAVWSFITCNHVLEHVTDYRKALSELHRVLRDDGILEIIVPADKNQSTTIEDKSIILEKDRKEKYGQEDHLRLFGNDFLNILRESGFAVEVIEGNKMPEKIRPVIGPSIFDDNRMYICRKTDKC